ncbi:Uncharacterised protein [Klebsiella pneumoniae]|nr:Uncharacterised protein [Klebsiella pneumoniae]
MGCSSSIFRAFSPCSAIHTWQPSLCSRPLATNWLTGLSSTSRTRVLRCSPVVSEALDGAMAVCSSTCFRAWYNWLRLSGLASWRSGDRRRASSGSRKLP